MSLRYAVLSLIALFVIFLLVLKNYETWTQPIEAPPERSTAKKQEAKIGNPPAPGPQKVAGSPQSYAVIAGKNIFSPERKDFPAQSSEGRRLVRPQVILYGVLISNEYQFASIVTPGRPLRKGERETITLRVGDKIGEYKLARILSDRIVVEGPEDSFEVLLYDPRAGKKRSDMKTETKPAAITTASPGPASLPGEAPKTAPQAQPVGKQREPVQPGVASPSVSTPPTPGALPTPRSPNIYRRGRSLIDYPPGTASPGGTLPATTPPGTDQTQGVGTN